MALPTSNIYYALNDRAINLLIKGKTDTNAVIGGTDEPTFSDAEISGLLEHGQEILITVVRNNETRPGGAFFPYMKNTIYDLDMVYLKLLIETIINMIAYSWLYKQVVHQISNYKN